EFTESVRGDVNVIYDVAPERGWEGLDASNRYYNANVSRLTLGAWREWTSRFNPAQGLISGFRPSGLTAMITRLRRTGLPLPGVYGCDTYGGEYATLVGAFDVLKKMHAGARRSIYIQETYYNDPQVASEIRRAIRARPLMRFGGVHQFPTVRGSDSFPDV